MEIARQKRKTIKTRKKRERKKERGIERKEGVRTSHTHKHIY